MSIEKNEVMGINSLSILCWIARITGLLLALFWLFIGIVTIIAGRESLDWLGGLFLLLIVFSLAAIGLAWWRSGLGAFLLFVMGLLQGAYFAVSASERFVEAVLFTAAPFFLTGLLFLWCWLRSRRTNTVA